MHSRRCWRSRAKKPTRYRFLICEIDEADRGSIMRETVLKKAERAAEAQAGTSPSTRAIQEQVFRDPDGGAAERIKAPCTNSPSRGTGEAGFPGGCWP